MVVLILLILERGIVTDCRPTVIRKILSLHTSTVQQHFQSTQRTRAPTLNVVDLSGPMLQTVISFCSTSCSTVLEVLLTPTLSNEMSVSAPPMTWTNFSKQLWPSLLASCQSCRYFVALSTAVLTLAFSTLVQCVEIHGYSPSGTSA